MFHSGLTKDQSNNIEKVQKKAIIIILGATYTNYGSALNALNLDRLDIRRTKLCYNFAVKCAESPKHCSMFPKNPIQRTNSRFYKP